jgi:hypothetical protein
LRKEKRKKQGAQSREGAKSAAEESYTEFTTISLRLCACLPQAGLCETKKIKKESAAADGLGAPQFCGAGCKAGKAQSLFAYLPQAGRDGLDFKAT